MSTRIVTAASAAWIALALQGCGPQPAAPKPAPPATQAPVAAAPAALVETADTSLTANPGPGEPRVSGCMLVGKAFGYITPGEAFTVGGVRYPVEKASGADNQVVLTGPNVRAVFTPRPGAKIQEDEGGAPLALAEHEPSGTLRIEVAGHVITTPAKEHCVIFE